MPAKTHSLGGGSSRQPDSSASWSGSSVSDRLLQAVDLGLAGVILVAPLFLGGRHPIGRLAFVSLICLTACCWAVRQALSSQARWRHTGAQWLLAAGAILVLLQIAPLPQSLLKVVSPSLEHNLPLWTDADSPASLGQWRQVSLSPAATRHGLALYVSYALLFLTVVQRVQSRRDIERLVKLVGVAAAGMALLGLAQYLFSNGKFLWVYAHPSRDTHSEVRAAFDNENHFAHFLALGIGPLIWQLASVWKQSGQRRSFGSSSGDRSQAVRMVLMLALLTVAVAGMMSFSRGGVAAILLAALCAVVILARARLIGWQAFAALAATGALVAAALWVHGYQKLANEVRTVAEGSLDTIDRAGARRHLWSAELDAVGDYWRLGSGVGSHAEVYPTYYEQPSAVEYEYAESGYLQLLVTSGVGGVLLASMGIGACLWWAAGVWRQAKSSETRAVLAAIGGGLAVSVAHSIVDFVWFIPACIATTAILAACLCRLYQLALVEGSDAHSTTQAGLSKYGGRTWTAPRPVWAAICATLAAASALIVYGRIGPARAAPHWNQFYALNLAASGFDNQDDRRGLSASFGEVSRLDPTTIQTLASHLEKTLAADDHHARAHLRMASICIRQFELAQLSSENPMALSQIRDAALASQFATAQAQDEWLQRAIGDNRRLLDKALLHARRAAALCPLQGRAYIYLSQLAFLEGPETNRKEAYVAQALRVRPHAGEVLIAAGAEAVFSGDQDQALAYWRKAFHQGPSHQHQILEILALTAPAEFIFEQFQPDMQAALLIVDHYQSLGMTEQAAYAAGQYASLVESNATALPAAEAAGQWEKAATVYSRLEDWPKALACAQQAARLAPQDFDKRLAHGRLLLQQEQYDDAVAELQWCLQRKPNDPGLQAAHTRAQQGRYRRASNVAPADFVEPLR